MKSQKKDINLKTIYERKEFITKISDDAFPFYKKFSII